MRKIPKTTRNTVIHENDIFGWFWGFSTPGSHHHHQHQETSFQYYHVAYLTMSNTNTLIITCLCYSARRDMLDPQTSLDSIFFPIPSFMAKKGLDPDVSMWLPIGADPTYPCDTPFNTFFSCYGILPSFNPHDARSWGW